MISSSSIGDCGCGQESSRAGAGESVVSSTSAVEIASVFRFISPLVERLCCGGNKHIIYSVGTEFVDTMDATPGWGEGGTGEGDAKNKLKERDAIGCVCRVGYGDVCNTTRREVS